MKLKLILAAMLAVASMSSHANPLEFDFSYVGIAVGANVDVGQTTSAATSATPGSTLGGGAAPGVQGGAVDSGAGANAELHIGAGKLLFNDARSLPDAVGAEARLIHLNGKNVFLPQATLFWKPADPKEIYIKVGAGVGSNVGASGQIVLEVGLGEVIHGLSNQNVLTVGYTGFQKPLDSTKGVFQIGITRAL